MQTNIMNEKYYILNNRILFKRNLDNNLFYIYEKESDSWKISGFLIEKFYDASYDIREVEESDLQSIIDGLESEARKK